MPKKEEIYNENSIEVLEGLEPVRLRPGMYIGSTGTRGLNHLIYEIVDNSVDEHMAGYCSEIKVTLNKDGSCTVQDNGRGIPVGMHKKGAPAVRIVLTTLHAGGKFGDGAYKTSGGLHGVGSSAVNALSTWMDVEISQDGYVHHDHYEKGVPTETLTEDGLLPKIRTTRSHGTKITFLPDPTIFEKTRFRESDIKSRLHEIAYINPGLTIIFKDMREDAQEPRECVFKEEGGIAKFVQDINAAATAIHEPIYFKGSSDDIEVECAFQYTDDFHENVMGFCNTIYNVDGGTHITGFKTALTSIINTYARGLGILKEKDENYSGSDIRAGLTAVVSIRHRDPRFEGQTKTKLDNPDAAKATQKVTAEQLELFFDRNLETLKAIIGQAERSAKIRKAEEKSKKNLLSKPKFSFESNGKLSNCNSKDASKCELIIVEGDSAGGSAKMARDREFQAILPIRGKILNVGKASMDKILANEEIKTLIYAMGAGFAEGYGNDFDISKLRYDKIIFACFSGDTKIKALDGKLYPFKKLADEKCERLWVYSLDKEGNVVPALATNFRKTGESSLLYKITLDNGKSFKCTPDHMIMTVDGNFRRADELSVGQSLMPLHSRINKSGYEEFYDKNKCAWVQTHRRVAETLKGKDTEDAKERLKHEDIPIAKKVLNIHHVDGNKLNNIPDNIKVMTAKEHITLHAVEYNKSDKHRERVKELWKDGVYDDYRFGGPLNDYNTSEKHKDDIRAAFARGAYNNRHSFMEYNKSARHREVVARTNASEKHILAANRGRIAKSVRFLMENGLPFDEYHYDYYRISGAASFNAIPNYFDNYDDVIAAAMKQTISPENYKPAREYSNYDNRKKQKQQIGNVINSLISSGQEFNEANYNAKKGARTVSYKNIVKWFGSYEEAYEYAENYNHKITGIEKIELENSEDVYCCTVDKYHNFLLSSGVFVKNCDADIDVRLVRM